MEGKEDMGKKLQDFSSSWVYLPDLNQNIMAEIARRRNVTDEFYDDIFKGKSEDTTSISSSKNLDPFLSRSIKDHGPQKQICDGLVSSKAANEYPTYGEKVKSWKDRLPEQMVKVRGKTKHVADSDINNGEGEDEFGSYVIEFGSDVKKEPN
ncbi:hypothetical protein SUGI_0444830 [Cryptomeria japonica]|nr:hypothetical protein SUGI_0444830 [Cryptomeria japonica]